MCFIHPITHNGGGLGGNSDIAVYPEQELVVIVLSNRIVWRAVTEELPFEVRLYATEASEQLVANMQSGDFTALPGPTFSISGYLLWGLSVAGVLGLGVVLWRRRRRV